MVRGTRAGDPAGAIPEMAKVDDEACTAAAGGCTGETGGRRRDRAGTETALLDAAKCVFAERGYDAATTREVAARAGVNEQLIQRYFGGKNGLLLAVVARYDEAETAHACTLPPPGDCLGSELSAFLRHQLAHAWRCRDFTKVILGRAMLDPDIAAQMAHTLREARIPCLLSRLEALRARGAIDPDADLPNVAAGIATLGFGLGFVDQVVFGEAPDRLSAMTESLVRTLVRGLAPRARD